MKNYLFATYISLLLLSISSCDNKIEINAGYKEIPIVYGLIDISEDQHYIRIEKAFQNSDNTSSSQITQIPDSLYFDTLVVKMFDANNPSNYILLDRYDGKMFPKDSGTFSSLRNTLYTTTKTLPTTTGTLGLEIYNPKSGKKYTASTPVIYGGEFKDFGSPFVAMNESKAKVIQYVFSKGNNAFMYDLFVRLYYKEMNASDTSITSDKTIDFFFEKGYLTSGFDSYSNNSYKKIAWVDFLRFLKVGLKEDASKIRRVSNLSFSAYGGSSELAELLELSKPVIGFVQKNSEYSNISNGALGIFTSRNYVYKEKALVDSSFYYIAKYAPNFIY